VNALMTPHSFQPMFLTPAIGGRDQMWTVCYYKVHVYPWPRQWSSIAINENWPWPDQYANIKMNKCINWGWEWGWSMYEVYKALNGLSPHYICELLMYKQNARLLRSSDQLLLIEPKMRLSTVGDRAFSSYAPRLWNSLPLHIKICDNVESFKSALKTYLFNIYYECWYIIISVFYIKALSCEFLVNNYNYFLWY
jgi:hypothetical protein